MNTLLGVTVDLLSSVRSVFQWPIIILGSKPDDTTDPLRTNGSGALKVSVVSDSGDAASISRNTTQGATKSAVKASAGTLQGYNIVNPNTYPVYIKFYNGLIADVTVGTTAPKLIRAIPPSGVLLQENAGAPLAYFPTGITIAITKNLADNDATAITTACLSEIAYK